MNSNAGTHSPGRLKNAAGLSHDNAKKLENGGWEYELTFHYESEGDLECQIDDLTAEMSDKADSRNGFIECSFSEVGTDRSW